MRLQISELRSDVADLWGGPDSLGALVFDCCVAINRVSFGAIVRLVRNCALGRPIQYSRQRGNAAAYWIPRLRGE